MRTIFALCAAVLIAGGVIIYRSTRMPNKYGTFTRAPAVAVAELIAHPKRHLRQTLATDGVIRNQCTTMGCYFFFFEGNDMLRVDLQEIAMYAPRRMNGHRALVEGVLVPFDGGFQLAATAVEFQ